MKADFYGRLFKFIRCFVRIFYPKYSVQIPEVNGPVVYVSHHQNLLGPFVILLWFPKCLHCWMLHVFLDRDACYKQYVDFTFTKRFGWNRQLAKLCASPISHFISTLLNSGKGIPVYRGSRKILYTLKQTVTDLSKGESVVIFPDVDYSDPSSVMKTMYDGFLYLEKYYYKASGEHVCFVPLYVSKKRHMIIADEPIYFPGRDSFNTEREEIRERILASLHSLANKCGDL